MPADVSTTAIQRLDAVWQNTSLPTASLIEARQAASRGDLDAVYYVGPNGSDSNSGVDANQAFQTIAFALRHVRPGDTILVLPGVYHEQIYSPPGGTPLHPVRIAAFDPAHRPVVKPGPGSERVLTFASRTSSHIEVDGFILDGEHVLYDAVKITWGESGGSHHIRIKNSDVRNAPENGILVSGHQYGVGYNEFLNLDIHGNGTSGSGHGIYISTPHNIVEFSRIFRNAGWGIHNFAGDPSHNTYRKNHVFENASAGGRGVGIGIYHGTNVAVSENIVEGNQRGISVKYGTSRTEIDGNILRRNKIALEIGPSAVDTVVTANTSEDNQSDRVIDEGINSTLDKNRIGHVEQVFSRRDHLASSR